MKIQEYFVLKDGLGMEFAACGSGTVIDVTK